MNRRKLATFLTAVPFAAVAVLAGPTVALADDSEAGATAVNVADQVVVSSTAASTEDDGSASATTVAVGGETVVGGTQEGEGEQSGEIVSTGENDQGELTAGSWETTVTEDESHARTAVADGRLGDTESDQYATVTVLESESTAREDGSNSSTTGARIDLGGQLMLELLHAETSSDGSGSSAIAYVNDEGIGTSEQAGGACEIPADPLAHLLCLYANEDSGELEIPEEAGDAGVAHLEAGDGALTGGLFQATAGPAGDSQVLGEEAAPSGGDSNLSGAPGGGMLPLTGGGIAAGLIGLGMLGAGGVLDRFRRRS